MFILVKKANNSANTQQKFKSELIANGNVESASGLLRKNGTELKQTKLSLCQKDNKLIFSGFVEEPTKIKPKHEFIYKPAARGPNKTVSNPTTTKIEPLLALPTTSMSKPGRNLLSLIGRVDFCIKMQRTQPQLNVIWNVYGKVIYRYPSISMSLFMLCTQQENCCALLSVSGASIHCYCAMITKVQSCRAFSMILRGN